MQITNLLKKLATAGASPKGPQASAASLRDALHAAKYKAYEANEHYINEYSSGASEAEVDAAKKDYKAAKKEVATLAKKYEAALKKEGAAAPPSGAIAPTEDSRAGNTERASPFADPSGKQATPASPPAPARAHAQSVLTAHRRAAAFSARQSPDAASEPSAKRAPLARTDTMSVQHHLEHADLESSGSTEAAPAPRRGRAPGTRGGLKQAGSPRRTEASVRFDKNTKE